MHDRRARRSDRAGLARHTVVAAEDEELARRDAERLAHLPPDSRERVLLLMAQLPALCPEVLARLAHHHRRGSVGSAARVRILIDGDEADYLLLPDYPDDELPRPGTPSPPARPVGFYEPVVRRILAHNARAERDRTPPRLLVTTETPERALAWRAMLQAMDDVYPSAPLGATIATWEGLADAMAVVLTWDLLGLHLVPYRDDST